MQETINYIIDLSLKIFLSVFLLKNTHLHIFIAQNTKKKCQKSLVDNIL